MLVICQLYQLKVDMSSMWNSTTYMRGTFTLLIVVLCVKVSLAQIISDLDGKQYMTKDIRNFENVIFKLNFLDNIPIQEILKVIKDIDYADVLFRGGMGIVDAKQLMRKRQGNNHALSPNWQELCKTHW